MPTRKVETYQIKNIKKKKKIGSADGIFFVCIKGQLISKCPFGVVVSTKIPKNF